VDNFANFAKSTLTAGVASSGTTLTVASGDGARFPSAPFRATLWNSSDYSDASDDPDREIILVTGVAVDTFTIERGQEGTTAADHDTVGKTYAIVHTLTANTLNAMPHTLVLASQFDKTNDVAEEVPGLSFDVEAGKAYLFRVVLYVDDGGNGQRAGLSGSVVPANLIGAAKVFTARYAIDGPLMESIRITSLYSAADDTTYTSGSGGDGFYTIEIEGYLSVSSGGTFAVQFAELSTGSAPSSVKAGSHFTITEIT
jgi:hypothetical protein